MNNLLPFNRENWQKAIEDGRYYPCYDDGCYALIAAVCDFFDWLGRRLKNAWTKHNSRRDGKVPASS